MQSKSLREGTAVEQNPLLFLRNRTTLISTAVAETTMEQCLKFEEWNWKLMSASTGAFFSVGQMHGGIFNPTESMVKYPCVLRLPLHRST